MGQQSGRLHTPTPNCTVCLMVWANLSVWEHMYKTYGYVLAH